MEFKDKVKDVSEKVGDVVEKTYKSVADSSSKFITSAKLKLKIGELEDKIKEECLSFGKDTYDKYQNGQELPDAEKFCKKVKKIKKEVQAVQEELLKIKNMRICDGCKNEISIDNKFCPICGEKQKKIKVETEVVEEVPTLKICPECAEELNASVNFCTKCGYKF